MPAELATKHLVMLAEKRLRAELERAGVTPVAAPVLDGDDLVKRVLDRRKPTKALKCDAKGKELPDQPEGFRDQLLWAHVRDAAMAGRVVFVTGNIRDFAGNNTAAEGRAELHPQLRDDLKRDRAEGGSIGDVELFLDVRTVVRELLQDDDILEIAAQLLDGDAGVEMRRAVTELVNGRRVVMDEFSPEDLVEGDIEEATLSTFVSADVEVELDDAYVESGEGEPRRYGVNATVAGAGDVDWYVSAPTAGDVHAFGDHVENAEDGGGLLQWRDEDLPIRLWVYGQYAPSTGEWSGCGSTTPQCQQTSLNAVPRRTRTSSMFAYKRWAWSRPTTRSRPWWRTMSARADRAGVLVFRGDVASATADARPGLRAAVRRRSRPAHPPSRAPGGDSQRPSRFVESGIGSGRSRSGRCTRAAISVGACFAAVVSGDATSWSPTP
jgi:hypothetical protein